MDTSDIDAQVRVKMDKPSKLEVKNTRNIFFTPIYSDWNVPDWFDFEKDHLQRANNKGEWWVAKPVEDMSQAVWERCTRKVK